MIAITPQMHILLATEPVDFRKGIDGLAGYVRNILDKDPFNGYVFVFSNIKRTSIKILVYDGQGFKAMSEKAFQGPF
jgi:transposase